MKKKSVKLGLILLSAIGSVALGSCFETTRTEVLNEDIPSNGGYSPLPSSNNDESNNDISGVVASEEEITVIEDLDTFKIETVDGTYEINDNVYTITSAGTYDLSGELEEGYIIVSASDTDEVNINLDGVSIKSTINSPILIKSASKVEISAKNGTINIISDDRENIDENDESQGSAAIYAECDLKLKGKGNLYVYGNINNGIHSKDDLELKNLSLYVKANNNALKGNDSVTIDSLTATIISELGDGIETTNSDISSKGNQRGIITITGAAYLDIYACCDGISAAYDFISETDANNNSPTVNIYTNAYSGYTLENASQLDSTMYLCLSGSQYNSSYYYYAYLYNDDSSSENGSWVKLNLTQTVNKGFTSYYYLSGNISGDYNGIRFYVFTSDSPSLSTYYAASTGQTINETKDMFMVSSISQSNKKIGGDWTNYSSQSQMSGPGGMGGMNDGNQDKTSYSTKGIKADNEISISSGVFMIKSYDDALHASSGVALENSETSKGNINISGGDLTITSKDDGIHSDGILTISGGNIYVLTAYEGLESPSINISDGNIYVYSTDDGLNASGNNANITISGGYVNIRVASGDTDAIDSNGTYTQTGGTVISANMSTSGTATPLDTDGSAKISGGLFIGFGNMETTPSLTNVKSSKISSSYSSGDYKLMSGENVLAEFELFASYSTMYIASSSGSYSLYKGSSLLKSFSL